MKHWAARMIDESLAKEADARDRLERRLNRFKYPLTAARANELVRDMATSAEDARYIRMCLRKLHEDRDTRLAF
jgi:hypothetical protein